MKDFGKYLTNVSGICFVVYILAKNYLKKLVLVTNPEYLTEMTEELMREQQQTLFVLALVTMINLLLRNSPANIPS